MNESLKCQIAGLRVQLPSVGNMEERCRPYQCCFDGMPDIHIKEEQFREDAWKSLSGNDYFYMETGSHFYRQLLHHDGLMLHASAVMLGNRVYLFSGTSGTGKSTHTQLWQKVFGEQAKVINDDKPALRRLNGIWYAYGTPWCGKDGINTNESAPVAGICFLKQGQENKIRRLGQAEAIGKLVSQTIRAFRDNEKADRMIEHVGKLVVDLPIFELINKPVPEAAILSYTTMHQVAEEMEL